MKRGAVEASQLTALVVGCLFLNVAGAHTFFAGARLAASDKNPILEALGETKEVLGDLLYLKSDTYFHGGLDADLARHEEPGTDNEDGQKHAQTQISSDWIYGINRQIRIVAHRHLEGEDAKEILPLLYGASRLDPGNPTVALATAYWIERQTGRAVDAVKVLEEAADHNPDSWEIRREIGNLLFKKMGKPADAVSQYERALASMKTAEVGPLDAVQVCVELGNALESLGRGEEARVHFREALALYPAEKQTALRRELEEKVKEMGRAQ